MGSLFRYIADDVARQAESGECPSCLRETPLFPIEAAIDEDEWSLEADCPEELCADCIRRLPLRKIAPRRCEKFVPERINAHHPKGTLNGEKRIHLLVSICDEFRRTPTYPLFLQDEDWPWCCGDFCEYLGVPRSYEESIRVGREMKMWPADYASVYGDMTLQPESLNEVCLFRCLHCGKPVFTWQMT